MNKTLLIPQNIGTYYSLEINDNYNLKAMQNGINNVFKSSIYEDTEFTNCLNFISNNANMGAFIYRYLLNNIKEFSNENLLKMKTEFIKKCFNGYEELIYKINSNSAMEWYVEYKIKQQILKVNSIIKNTKNQIMSLI